MEQTMNAARLIVCRGLEEVKEFPIAETMFIGRKKPNSPAEIQVDTPLAGDIHGKITKDENGYIYKDLGTKYGTYYNDGKIGTAFTDDESWVKLTDGDVLRIDNKQFGSSDENAIIMIFRRKYDDKSHWKTLELEDKGSSYFLSCREESEGEEIWQEAEAEKDGELPKKYAVLKHDGHTWSVAEHNTKYGIYINGQLVEEGQPLHLLDVIRIGNTLFVFQESRLLYNHKEACHNKLVIHIEERSVWKMFRKQLLLKDIDLSIDQGEMVLILGGSGAGKTTFINAVMGYEKAQGSISQDGVDIYKNYNQMKYEIGFVPQQDLLRLEDTVRETLENAAEIKMPKDTSKEELNKRVDEVLELFGLDREIHSMVEKLSGGQRKRLSIAVEYIVNPKLFFLDEPDSGLDGVMARHLMESLRQIANQDTTVLVITHSPDRVIDLFDKMLVLAKGTEDNIGHLAFYGTPQEARRFFEVEDMEAIVRKMNRTDEGGEGLADQYIEKYRQMEER